MKMVKYYLIISVLCVVGGLYTEQIVVSSLLYWVGLSLLLVSVAYVFDRPSIFRKREDGSIPTYIRWLFFPFLAGADAYNWFARRFDKVPAIQQVTDDLYLACRLLPNDVTTLKRYGVTAILDVTAEFDGLDWSSEEANLGYLNIPVLDHKSPNEAQLRKAIAWIKSHIDCGGKVVVHCALGRGRSVFVTAAYLLTLDDTLSVVDVMNKVQTARQTARLNKGQLKALKHIQKSGGLKLHSRVGIVANPVAGGGKWRAEKSFITERLETQFELVIHETTKETSARQLAKRLIEQDCQLIIACGGDGTLAEVAEVVIEHGITLGIIPLGTANALSMVLLGSESKIAPISTACDALLEQQVAKIDTATCNNRRILLVCGIGVEAEMIKRSDRAEKNAKGQMAYLQFFADAMLNAQPQTLTIQLDNHEPQTLDIQSFVVANAAPPSTVLAQGGGNPDLFDGLLDVSWFEQQENLVEKVTSLFGLTMSGLLDGKHSDGVSFKRATRVVIEAQKPFDYVLDGEVFSDSRVEITSHPRSLSVICSSDVTNSQNNY